ncbi:hypothetical protein, partial [Gluconacetobacter sp.]|uniref:hypothetical protein n=1 Tax=Gluconacetobacter sp. TaxID=1935994 RepID=UPI0039EB9344
GRLSSQSSSYTTPWGTAQGQSVVFHDWGVGLMVTSPCVSGQSGAVTSRTELRACDRDHTHTDAGKP